MSAHPTGIVAVLHIQQQAQGIAQGMTPVQTDEKAERTLIEGQ